MELAPTADEQMIADVFSDFFTTLSPPEVVRAAEPGGFDTALWARLVETGAPAMGADESIGGGGATLTDLAVVAEAYGRRLAPVPLIEHQVATRLVGRLAPDLAAELVDATSIATIALRPAFAGEQPEFRVVPAGAVAPIVVGVFGADLVLSKTAPGALLTNHGCAPLAHRPVAADPIVLASGDEAAAAFNVARAEWETLTAHALCGLAAEALAMGVTYAKERTQFGQPIGSFQAIQHALAECPGPIEGGRLLAHKAAWARDGGDGTIDPNFNDYSDFETLATMAFLHAAETAAHVTDRSLHTHGGYGFADEYDIQLYYRRARSWALVAGDTGSIERRLADRLATA